MHPLGIVSSAPKFAKLPAAGYFYAIDMEQKKLSDLTDGELLQEAKKMKTAKRTNAVMIGFLAGIIFYSIMVNHIGWFTLIPLFLIYKLVNNSRYDSKELQQLIKERNLE